MDKIKILGIAGSLRKNSLNKGLLRAASELKPDYMEIEIFDIKDIPSYNSDLEPDNVPEPVKELKKKIAESDGLLIATPEYNYSIPGVLKNAIDWVSRPPATTPLNNKPLALMGASGGTSGTVRSQMHLRHVAVFTNMLTMNRPEILVQKGPEKFDEQGNLKDENTREHIKKFLIAFAEWVRRLKN
jgi:chromate reductase, NAD(P)H dehydrogenase (quinone)